jgi:outer membrane lipoprotein-sorting protein
MQKRQLIFEKLIILLLLSVTIGGCVKNQIIPPDAATEKILTALCATISENQVFSAIAQIDIVSPQGNYPLKAVVVARKPAYLRLELLPVIGPPDFFLVANPQEMKILLPSKSELYRGQPTDVNLAHFLPWKFGINEIVMILLGSYPLLSGEPISYQSSPAEEKAMQIEMKSLTGSSQTITVDKEGHLIKVVRYDTLGREIYTVRYEDYEEGRPIAGKINVSMADGTISITVKYSNLKVRNTTDLLIFDLPFPAGYRSIMMD